MESTSLSADWIELLRGLNDASVKFLVVGAHALGIHGEPRATGDLDIWVEREGGNAERLFRALAAFGAPLGDVSIADLQADDMVFSFGAPPGRVDVLTDISGVTFSEAWRGRVQGRLGGVPVSFIGREEFLKNKRAAGRPKDLADVESVERNRKI